MIEIRRTEKFDKWFCGLADPKAKARVLVRIDRLRLGILGDVKAIGSGISEIRIDYGPGYRVYYTRIGKTVVLLLAGGNKNSQKRDIQDVRTMINRLEK